MRAQGGDIVGDNTGSTGMSWTKPTNIGLDLISTMFADKLGFIGDKTEGPRHIKSVLTTLLGLKGYQGIFPEMINIIKKGDQLYYTPQVNDQGNIGYSTLDSAWLTVGINFLQIGYTNVDQEIVDLAT